MGITKKKRQSLGWIPTAAVFLLIGIWLFSALGDLQRGSGEEGRKQLELALQRSAAACYAAEGIYPPSVDYLVDHYGIQIEDKYVVYYDVFASNLMPEITVLEKGAQ